MGKKAKDKGKDKANGSKRKGTGGQSSRELPTVVEEDVSVVDNQILCVFYSVLALFGPVKNSSMSHEVYEVFWALGESQSWSFSGSGLKITFLGPSAGRGRQWANSPLA
ncbi:hypothetical protein PIB30_067504 [Stylosanthes scabra]|uniref:Uncharacterized protein n=1 Tax=Stylosanthes scabra TaxID=79078 RepID=A0ABU6TMD0_9FABA|nr:hypothetical protein [Stylosanthes scabra]